MQDAYVPPLAAFSLDASETAAVAAAMLSVDPWNFVSANADETDGLKKAKAKILDYHLERHNQSCCYCRTNLKGAGPFMTDREHILPKGKAAYKQFSYAMWNLAAACKRCNMQFKGQKDAFVIDKVSPNMLQSGANYLFIHPNFDRYEDYLSRVEVAAHGKRIVAFQFLSDSPKAHYTHMFFKLEELVANSFDRQQGAPFQAEVSELGQKVLDLAEHHNQRSDVNEQ